MNTKKFYRNHLRGGSTNAKIRITRKDKRKALENFKLCVELWKIIKHFFPDLIPLLRRCLDHRHQSYVDYENHVLLFVRVLGAVFRIESMRGMSEELNKTVSIKNISRILELEEELTELPHWKTINDYLEKLKPTELEAIIPKLIKRITRMRSFENSRIRNKYWHVVVDGTHLFTFNERHCKHCSVREFKDKKTKIVYRREYYHSVLEAKLVLFGGVVVSIATEFIENESADVSKQDCELKAFYRMAAKLKKNFPRLPICLGLDSLYAAGPVFELCKRYGWHYIIRFKDGSIKSVAAEFHALKHIEPEQVIAKQGQEYRYVLKIPYQAYELNIVEFIQNDLPHPFVFITGLPITRQNCIQLVEDGRRRWQIENEGFNEQKNHGLGLNHMFSENYKAMKNHYVLIQIGHMIAQLLEFGIRRLCELSKMATVRIFALVKEAFRTLILTDEDEALVHLQTQYRLRC